MLVSVWAMILETNKHTSQENLIRYKKNIKKINNSHSRPLIGFGDFKKLTMGMAGRHPGSNSRKAKFPSSSSIKYSTGYSLYQCDTCCQQKVNKGPFIVIEIVPSRIRLYYLFKITRLKNFIGCCKGAKQRPGRHPNQQNPSGLLRRPTTKIMKKKAKSGFNVCALTKGSKCLNGCPTIQMKLGGRPRLKSKAPPIVKS